MSLSRSFCLPTGSSGVVTSSQTQSSCARPYLSRSLDVRPSSQRRTWENITSRLLDATDIFVNIYLSASLLSVRFCLSFLKAVDEFYFEYIFNLYQTRRLKVIIKVFLETLLSFLFEFIKGHVLKV